jgi:hypothetical protein
LARRAVRSCASGRSRRSPNCPRPGRRCSMSLRVSSRCSPAASRRDGSTASRRGSSTCCSLGRCPGLPRCAPRPARSTWEVSSLRSPRARSGPRRAGFRTGPM